MNKYLINLATLKFKPFIWQKSTTRMQKTNDRVKKYLLCT